MNYNHLHMILFYNHIKLLMDMDYVYFLIRLSELKTNTVVQTTVKMTKNDKYL